MSKKVFVEYTGVISSYSGNKQEWVEIEDNILVKDLLIKLGYKSDFHKFIAIRVDGEEVSLDSPIKDNAAVTLFLPAGGG